MNMQKHLPSFLQIAEIVARHPRPLVSISGVHWLAYFILGFRIQGFLSLWQREFPTLFLSFCHDWVAAWICCWTQALHYSLWEDPESGPKEFTSLFYGLQEVII